MGADAFFAYARTDANVADEPSKRDMKFERYELGADVAAGARARRGHGHAGGGGAAAGTKWVGCGRADVAYARAPASGRVTVVLRPRAFRV